MNPMNHQPYLDWLLATTSPDIRQWLGDDVLQASIRDEFHETIADRMESPAWGQRYVDACPWEGAQAVDYHLRELPLLNDLSMLAGIHFYGRRKLFRFVGVFAQSREIAAEELPRVVELLLDEFALFEPSCVQLWDTGKALNSSAPGVGNRITGDCRLVAGRLADLQASSPHPESADQAEELSLEEDFELECYESYCEIYQEFFADHPQWLGLLEIESRESLQECIDAGGLRRVMIRGELAGLIASKPNRYRGVPGWLMIDEVLAKPFRGRGYAPIMQQKFLRELDSGICDLVIGTIDNKNQPSFRTARRCGRVDAGGHIFVYP